MILKDNLFHIKSDEPADKGRLFHFVLDPSHVIYKAHFPGQPITPGVCIIQIVKELLEVASGRELEILQVKNVKFLNILSPSENPEASCVLSRIQDEPENRCVKAQAVLFSEDRTFAKASLICSYR